ncbi:hypothetical protein A9Q76_06420 [Arcobacter sp. 31_11_sub10_T18]|nr:hypothetical protein A9Q76_06420 [Arcobacter sp. 31_11_sub10_T18]
MKELFLQVPALIVFLHVISAVIWVGGMIAIRFAVHYSMQNILEPKIKLGRTLENLKRFFNMLLPFIALLLITALILIFGLEFKDTPLNKFVHMKESIWIAMTLIYITVYVKRNKAQKAFDEEDFKEAKKQLAPIAKIYIPLNIFLGLVAIYLGVTLRGF